MASRLIFSRLAAAWLQCGRQMPLDDDDRHGVFYHFGFIAAVGTVL